MHIKRVLLPLLLLSSLLASAKDRESWTTSRIQGSPEPPPPYTPEVIWPHITFSEALDITLLESRGKFFITERLGKIWILPADLNAQPDKAELCGDLKALVPGLNALYGLAFHPDFKANRKLYLFYVVDLPNGEFESRISVYKTDEFLSIDPDSGEVLITFGGGGHNGGDLHFGPDGMLYFTVGDLAPPSPPDPNNAGQDLGNLDSTIARIDVDRRDRGLAYGIPGDNPFVNSKGARPEIWAFGFRNPWKMCFKPGSNEIWLGDVGWEMWEMVHRVVKGGNYGWSVMEGPVPLKYEQKMGPVPISPPVAYYFHTEGASVTGGYFMSGSRFPDLDGNYIYGDYNTGKIWALDWDGKSVRKNRLIAESRKQIVTFGQDAHGEVIFLDWPDEQHLHRLVPNVSDNTARDFPKRLSETGLFDNVQTGTVSPGVYSFTIQAPMWQDGFDSDYWVAVPDEGGFKTTVNLRQDLPVIRYEKPKNTVLVKTLHKDGFRVETQILHWDGYWSGYSYQWNAEQTDATLVHKDGLETSVLGKPWRFPSRAECVRCHGGNFNRLLAFFPGQMNRDGQLQDFHKLGLIDKAFVEAGAFQPLANPYEATALLEQKARSWLHANCSHCHRFTGGAGLLALMNAGVPNDRLEMIQTPPAKGNFGLEGAPLIEPGNPYRSILYYRISTKGAGHMPMIGAKTMDREGIRLVHDWIRALKPETPLPNSTLSPKNVEEALALYHKIQSGVLSPAEAKQGIAACLSSSDPFVLNLFAGFTTDQAFGFILP